MKNLNVSTLNATTKEKMPMNHLEKNKRKCIIIDNILTWVICIHMSWGSPAVFSCHVPTPGLWLMIKLAYLDNGHLANVLLLLLQTVRGSSSTTAELFSDAADVLACGFALLLLVCGLI